MNVQFKKGALELCVLALMNKKDRYGYEIIEVISREFEVAEGTIYPLLKRLQLDGHCESYLQESSGGPPRKYYRITPPGRQHVKQMIKDWSEFTKAVDNIIT
ncbi:MAG: PadR family transcriptional regulator [Oligoflexales bacterium]